MKDIMKISWILIVCMANFGYSAATQSAVRYDDFKVYRVFIKDEQQLNEFIKLGNNMPIRYLNEITGAGRNYDVVIDPANQNLLESQFRYEEFEFLRTSDDLQRLIEADRSSGNGKSNSKMEWSEYHDIEDIYNWLDELSTQNHNIIQTYTIGYSYEGQPIKVIKISAKKGNKAIFVESGIHAVEWIGSATTTCFFENLLNSNDAEMKLLLTSYDWIFVPLLNPDGFQYTHHVERLWRKNRKPTGYSNSSGICYGTDLNRNFNYKWGVNSYNFDVPCDHWYAGAEAQTEPEVVALQNFVNTFENGYIRMYLAFHSYGNWVLLPYGHTNEEFPPNYDQMLRIGNAFAEGAKIKYGTEFETGASGVLNYPVSGASKDWAYGVKKIPFTATIELRDKGQYGFFLPASQILEVCAEVTDGIIAMVKQAEAEHLFNGAASFGKNVALFLPFLSLLTLFNTKMYFE